MPQTKEEVLSRRTKATPVSVEGYGDYYIRRLTLAERTSWNLANEKTRGDGKILHRLLVLAIATDESGARMFSDGEEDLLAGGLESPVVEVLTDEALKLNKLRQEDKTPKAIATAAKN